MRNLLKIIQEKKNEIIFGTVLVFALTAGVSLWGNVYKKEKGTGIKKIENKKETEVEKKEAEIIQVSQKISIDEDVESQGVEIEEGKTALDLLKSEAAVELKGVGKDSFVVAINGMAADEEKKEFWAFYVNGEMAQVGAGSYKLAKDDKIEWKLETY